MTDVVLRSDGSTAWIGFHRVVEPEHQPSGPAYGTPGIPPPIRPFHSYLQKQVVACSATGELVLDEGVGINPKSLELHGSTLTWTKFGETRSAVLE